MAPEWADRHAQGARTDSRTLPPAAFPSLPLYQPQAAVTRPTSVTFDIIDLTESDEEEDADWAPPASNEPKILSEVSRMAIEYHFGKYPRENRPVDDIVQTERRRMIKEEILPQPQGLPETEVKRPRAVNCDHLQTKHEELTNKRKALEIKLRMLGYTDPALQASIDRTVAGTLPKTRGSIESLWDTVQDLRWLTRRLELMESHARHITKAKKKFFTRWPKPEKPKVKYELRRGCKETCVPAIGWDYDPDWQAMQATAKKSYSVVDRLRPWNISRVGVESAKAAPAEVADEDVGVDWDAFIDFKGDSAAA